ncbi:MAG: metallopeptidase (SprT family) [Halioglobus sp.]|nr:metallopeptidase (SprT family) [Halioglobus sp.]
MAIAPIDSEQRRRVEAETDRYVRMASEFYEREFPRIAVLFDLKGHTAGMFRYDGKRSVIRYNPWIFAKYFELNLRDTVPHEVAHYIVHELYPFRRVKPHGSQWQRVMDHFEADPGVTFDLDLSDVPQRRQRTHPYRCACQLHDVSTTRHNRMQRGKGQYLCLTCNVELVYAGAG